MMRITYDCPTCHRIIDGIIDFDDLPSPFTDIYKVPCATCTARKSIEVRRDKYRRAMPGFFTRLSWALFGIPRISLDWLPDVAKASLLPMPEVAEPLPVSAEEIIAELRRQPVDEALIAIDPKRTQTIAEPRVFGGLVPTQPKYVWPNLTKRVPLDDDMTNVRRILKAEALEMSRLATSNYWNRIHN